MSQNKKYIFSFGMKKTKLSSNLAFFLHMQLININRKYHVQNYDFFIV